MDPVDGVALWTYRRTSKCLMAAALALVVAFWTAFGIEAWSRSALRAQLERYPVPMVLVGLPIDIGPVAPLVAQSLTLDPFLLIVVSDECGFCRAAVPQWTRQFRAPNFPADLAVVVVSVQGDQLAEDLDRARRSAGLRGVALPLRPGEAKIFAARSGVLWTPALIVLDRSLRGLLVLDDLGEASLSALQLMALS